ncbi:MAG: ATP:cob(I)alamin adenosyltransferase [Candidatus Izemoplasmatales bacterium]|nr:ATP:cob(I)alamin adenosyltransferase [Candidatus Izemoplasmatales bacterium]MDD4069191.1 ATP:cob(I)alamin adenosyltransferase [Candidatus Izemoplasmatales bacterium]
MPINKLDLITTKLGDKGKSKDFENRSYSKSHIIFDTLGSMDELSSFLGLVYHYHKNDYIKEIQMHIQNINSLIASEYDSDMYNILTQIKEEDVLELEKQMQSMLDNNSIEARFYLPGSEKSKAGAYVDVARALTRKIERKITAFIETEKRVDLELSQKYINRLSDYLFVLSFNV